MVVSCLWGGSCAFPCFVLGAERIGALFIAVCTVARDAGVEAERK
jgi:hypothetical protein